MCGDLNTTQREFLKEKRGLSYSKYKEDPELTYGFVQVENTRETISVERWGEGSLIVGMRDRERRTEVQG